MQDQCQAQGIPTVVTSVLIKSLKVGLENRKVLFKSSMKEVGWTLEIFIITLKKVRQKFQVSTNLTDPTECNFTILKILSLQNNFANELTLHICGPKSKMSPQNCRQVKHLFFWCSKAPLLKKRSKETFRKLLVESADGKKVLNIHRA